MTLQKLDIYVDIKEAAQILNNVSIRTAYRYIDKGSAGLSVEIIDDVLNGSLRKLYKKEDIVNLAIALNKDKTVLSYVPVNVRGSVTDSTKSDALSTNVSTPPSATLTRKKVVKLFLGTFIASVITMIGIVLVAGYLIAKAQKQSMDDISNMLANLKTEIWINQYLREMDIDSPIYIKKEASD